MPRRQVEGGGIEHGKLPVQEIDQLRAVLDIRRYGTDALAVVAAGQNFGRAIGQGHLVVARRGEQLGHGGADLAGADHDDILHAPSDRSSEPRETRVEWGAQTGP